ncbi:uncharacterized protein B0P05DRAFT_477523, partial [Gilbertella persicaria]|uniref:uncharacterized protein n=1 Tax=Gilbertella persicaria TaxID=101096 RepID=UPI002220DB38
LASMFLICVDVNYTYLTVEESHAQVVPVDEKGNPTDPINYYLISLTINSGKTLKTCIKELLQSQKFSLDTAQDGFGECKSVLG